MIERRIHPRLALSFMMRSRHKGGQDSDWHITTIKDISEGGCFLYFLNDYEEGEVLDIEIHFPLLANPLRLSGEVQRCESYGTAVAFLEMNKKKKMNSRRR
ncbi:PilZ domain-containing protein [Thermoproteota archaeon]